MKIILSISVLLTICCLLACTKGGELQSLNGDRYAVTSEASSKQVVPAIDTTSTATFNGLYDEETNILSFTVTWDDLWRDTNKDTITSIVLYGPANAMTNGPQVKSLSFVSTNKAGSIKLGIAGGNGFTSSQSKDFLSSAYYFTINTKRYPLGIVRGQLAVAKQ